MNSENNANYIKATIAYFLVVFKNIFFLIKYDKTQII